MTHAGAEDQAGSTTTPLPPFQWSKFLMYLASFCILILLAGLLVGMAVGMRPLEARAAKVVSHTPVKIEILWPTMGTPAAAKDTKAKAGASAAPQEKPQTWLPRQQQEELLALAHEAYMGGGALAGRDGFSRSPLERIGQALGACGWFDGTPKVRRAADSTLVVDGAWRVPAALVRHDGKDYLISWDGKPMPLTYNAGSAKSIRVIIDPAMGPPMNQDGTRDFVGGWQGEDIAASLELLAQMSDKPWARQVAGVDASEYSSHNRLTLVTPENTRVVWGGRPSKPAIGEVSTAQKLAYLAQLLHDFKRIDAGHELVYINGGTLQFDISATAGRR